jgi:hypothetical protein
MSMLFILAAAIVLLEDSSDAPLRPAPPRVQRLLAQYTKHGRPATLSVKKLTKDDIGCISEAKKAKVIDVGATRFSPVMFDFGGTRVTVTNLRDQQFKVGQVVDLSKQVFQVSTLPPDSTRPVLLWFHPEEAEPYLSQHLKTLQKMK